MSTFEGKLLEQHLSFIRIDNFEPKNYDGVLFFLSHFHSDHCKGLFDEGFAQFINNGALTMVFCSKFTRSLILKMPYCKLSKTKIHPLELNHSHPFHYENADVELTAIPSGHCPGSVMFLIQSCGMNILYTGDFRISASDISKIRVLHDRSGDPLNLTTLYLDTTFCDKKWLQFPSRQQTEEDVLSLVQNWLELSHDHEIGIWYNSYHGLEFLLILLARTLKTRIWVIDSKAFENYSCIPELHDSVCSSKGTSRIHLCPVKTQGNCRECVLNRINTKTIKPCAQSFHHEQLQQGRMKQTKTVTRVAYSTHCSLKELVDIVNYLSPKNIYPCVIPDGMTPNQVLYNLKLDVSSIKNLNYEENFKKKSSSSHEFVSPSRKRICTEQEAVRDSFVLSSSSSTHLLSPRDTSEVVVNSSDKDEDAAQDSHEPTLLTSIIPHSPPVIMLDTDEDEVKSLSESDSFGLDSPPL